MKTSNVISTLTATLATSLATSFTIALPAFAGQINLPEVTITVVSPTQTTAKGSLMGARLSNDTVQAIGCKLTSEKRTIGGTKTSAECTAVNAQGTVASCRTSDSFFVQNITSMTATSVVTFTSDSTLLPAENCKSLTIDNTSAAGY